jgi:hypothetical protein
VVRDVVQVEKVPSPEGGFDGHQNRRTSAAASKAEPVPISRAADRPKAPISPRR